jgi:asparagine synthase (glutamine-hydrolysing)
VCGIAGWFDPRGFDEPEARAPLVAMTDAIAHRGPDDEGMWLDGRAGIALGFRRLAILDLSPTGRQPMLSASGRFAIVFNGEIYNFRRLRDELEALGHAFRGRSDTEVLLAAVSEWGLRGALERANGMFAFALWDREERVLHLARDRGGEKPLYYGWTGDTLLFGSELKALTRHPRFAADVDRGALARYLRRGYLMAPLTIYRGVFKLPAGTVLRISAARRDATPEPYWSWRETAERGAADPFTGSDEEAIVRLDDLVRDAVRIRLESDVPLGAFLSGGVDSSLIVAVMQRLTDQPVRTFTIGFLDPRFDETANANGVARHLGTDHTARYVTAEDARAVIPRLPELYDEPFTDSAQIPALLVATLARREVTVCLSGDAGDEVFGGYPRFWHTAAVARALGRMPRGVRTAAAAVLRGAARGSALDVLGRMVGGRRSLRERVRWAADALAFEAPEALYHYVMSLWRNPGEVVPDADEPLDALASPEQWASLPTATERAMYLDAVTHLPGQMLTKVDRATMAVSLEGRIPLLDHRIVEFAARLPLRLKVRGGTGKWILRQLAYRYVPRALLDRPKHGFNVPISAWLRGPLRPWAEALLDERRLIRDGYLAPGPVRRKWDDLVHRRTNRNYEVWTALMFQAWLEAQREARGVVPERASVIRLSAAVTPHYADDRRGPGRAAG